MGKVSKVLPHLSPEEIQAKIRQTTGFRRVQKFFANRIFHSLDDVEDTLCKGINHLALHPEYVKSLTNFPF